MSVDRVLRHGGSRFFLGLARAALRIDWLYQSFTAHQHQKGHTVPKQVSPLDADDITESTRKKCHGSTLRELHCLRTALRESIRYQAKSEQNVRQDLIPRVRHGEAALCTPAALRRERIYRDQAIPLDLPERVPWDPPIKKNFLKTTEHGTTTSLIHVLLLGLGPYHRAHSFSWLWSIMQVHEVGACSWKPAMLAASTKQRLESLIHAVSGALAALYVSFLPRLKRLPLSTKL